MNNKEMIEMLEKSNNSLDKITKKMTLFYKDFIKLKAENEVLKIENKKLKEGSGADLKIFVLPDGKQVDASEFLKFLYSQILEIREDLNKS